MQGFPESQESLGSALKPEAILDGERDHDAVGREFGKSRHTGLEPKRTLAYVPKTTLRGNPQRTVRRRQNLGAGFQESRRAAGTLEIDPEGTDAAEDAVLLEHGGIDGRVAFIGRKEMVRSEDIDHCVPPARVIR